MTLLDAGKRTVQKQIQLVSSEHILALKVHQASCKPDALLVVYQANVKFNSRTLMINRSRILIPFLPEAVN